MSDSGRVIEFDQGGIQFLETIETLWEIPLPPYIKEKLENSSRYQTVFNEVSWSVAAPTAGLHFTPELMEKLEKKWVKIEKVLLHVWLGTFKWVETENITDHTMHHEYIELEEETAKKLNTYKSKWKRIIAVGTTSIRVLESFSNDVGVLSHWNMETNIFIYPWYKWKFVDAMITNFHLPKSTLLMLISSFAWKDNIDTAYQYAIEKKFRFFSFWDALFIK
jgi:S-adenosylmethionine:tRNA ribosyltransferase-isomerase